jgi:hypothetical protein
MNRDRPRLPPICWTFPPFAEFCRLGASFPRVGEVGKVTPAKSQPLVAYDLKLQKYFANRVANLAKWQRSRSGKTISLNRCNRCMQSLQRCNEMKRMHRFISFHEFHFISFHSISFHFMHFIATGVCAKRATMKRIASSAARDKYLQFPH